MNTHTYILLKDYSTPECFFAKGTGIRKNKISENLYSFEGSTPETGPSFGEHYLEAYQDFFQKVEPEVKEFTESEAWEIWLEAWHKRKLDPDYFGENVFKKFIKSIRDKSLKP